MKHRSKTHQFFGKIEYPWNKQLSTAESTLLIWSIWVKGNPGPLDTRLHGTQQNQHVGPNLSLAVTLPPA